MSSLAASPRSRIARVVAAAALLALLTGCAPDPAEPAPETPAPTTSVATASPTASPTPTSTAVTARIPSDCTAILSAGVSAQLAEVPLNAPGTGVPTGVQSDGSLVCLWRDPAADTTYLETTISRMARGPALDMLNALADGEGYTCYTPDDGTRCERTWQNDTYGVTDGRTLFWRDDILIDTRYSNLAPTGYTAGVVAAIFG